MASREPIARLLARYLDPSKRWDAKSEAALRDLIRDDMDARARYREAVTAHRLMVGADPQFPSGFETSRMRDAVVEAAAPTEAPLTRRVAIWGGLLAAGAAALLLTIGPMGQGVIPAEGADDSLTDLRARSGAAPTATVGLGLSGVSRANPSDEYEIVAGGGVHLGDFLRVYTTNERSEVTHLFVLVRQPERAPIWYAPMPPEQTQSVALGQGRAVMLTAEYAVDAERYAAGSARAIALFTTRPLTVSELTPHLDGALDTMTPSAAAAALGKRLGLAAPSEVVVLPFTVSPARGADAP